jgi:hypothetical protein
MVPVRPFDCKSRFSGKHLRHARDHFSLLLDSVESQPPYVLDYDARSRNQPMETSRQAAHDSLKECIARLERIVPAHKMDEPLTLNAVTPYPQTMQSTFGREVSKSLVCRFALVDTTYIAVVFWTTCCTSLVHGKLGL